MCIYISAAARDVETGRCVIIKKVYLKKSSRVQIVIITIFIKISKYIALTNSLFKHGLENNVYSGRCILDSYLINSFAYWIKKSWSRLARILKNTHIQNVCLLDRKEKMQSP